MTNAPPEWLAGFVNEWAERLGILHVQISVRIDYTVNGEGDTLGMCNQYPERNEATLVLRGDLEDTKEWRINVLHELLHVAHMQIDHYLTDVVLTKVIESQRVYDMVHAGYKQHYEAYVDRLAHSLYAAHEEHQDGRHTDD